MSATGTRTASTTATFAEQVNRVTRNVQTDLLELVDTYHQIDEATARKYIADFRTLLYDRYLQEVELYWTPRGSDKVIRGYKYTVSNGEAIRPLDRAGGISWEAAKSSAEFHVEITYSAAWLRLSDAERKAVRDTLQISWGPTTGADHSGGSYSSFDRTYGQASVGVSRQEFRPS